MWTRSTMCVVLSVLLVFGAIISETSVTSASEIGPRPQQRLSVQTSDWVGFAVSRNGRVFISDTTGTEDGVRSEVVDECEQATQRSCNAIAVKAASMVTMVHCRHGNRESGFVGGSGIDRGAADWIAFNKALKDGFFQWTCTVVHRY